MYCTRRNFNRLGALALGGLMTRRPAAAADVPAADLTLTIASCEVELSARKRLRTIAYNGQVPGPLLRLQEGRQVTIEVHNQSPDPEVVHWHGLHLPPDVDGAMEEGTPMIAPGATARYSFTPEPAGFRWYHTHTFAGNDLKKAQYGGQHGFLWIEPRENPGHYDREYFLALHDWRGEMLASDDGSTMPVYDTSTINGKVLGFGERLRVREGERVLLHLLNSSPTEVHWLSLSGHRFEVIALDGNPVARPQTVDMLRLAPAERISAIVTMNAPGVWVLGEVREHVQAAGMGIVIEYAGAAGKPAWQQPQTLVWSYEPFAEPASIRQATPAQPIELVFDSKFEGHGSEELWRINGRSYPHTEEPILQSGQAYRLVMKNLSLDWHPIHLHRHTFEILQLGKGPRVQGLRKDVVLIPPQATSEIAFVANHPGKTLLHCHQQDHMDRGFMMLFRYA